MALDNTPTATTTPARPALVDRPGGADTDSAPLDPAWFADAALLRTRVATWSSAELYDLAALLSEAADERVEGELLGVLREIFGRLDAPPVITVEFVTNPNYDDGVYWSDEPVYLHFAGGAVLAWEPPEADDEAFDTLDERFRDLLADYSRLNRPVHNEHLLVDLASGAFDRS